jgi:plasmid stability protein
MPVVAPRGVEKQQSAMPTHTITLQIPEDLYGRIRQRAERSQRTVEAEFVDVLVQAVPGADELPPVLAEALAALEGLDDAELWQAARERLPDEVSAELQSLHAKQQRTGLTIVERHQAEELCLQFDQAMLTRARAALLLKERGYDVASLHGKT